MKIKSIAGVTYYVTDLAKTIDFYEKLGFNFKVKEEDHATAYINWAWIDFVATTNDDKPHYSNTDDDKMKSVGAYTYLTVDSIEDTYEELISLGFEPAIEPTKTISGNIEIVLQDPDGYNLVFFRRK